MLHKSVLFINVANYLVKILNNAIIQVYFYFIYVQNESNTNQIHRKAVFSMFVITLQHDGNA